MELIGTKVTAMVLLGLLKLGCGLLPIFLVKVLHFKKSSTMDKFMGIILCIGGGVLLSTVFIHMIPEVRESLAHAGDLGYMPDAHYAFAELVICLGFFLVYGVEALVHRFVGGHGHSHGVAMGSQVAAESRNTIELRQGMDNGGFEQDLANLGSPQKGHTKAVSGENNSLQSNGKTGKSPFVQNGKPKSFQTSGNVYNVSSATLTSYTSYSDGDSVDTSLPSYMPRPNRTFNTLESLAKEKNILVTIRNFLIVIALSIHSVFEGMAIGLQMTSPDVWKLFTAVSIHAWAILFCIGMDMIVEGTKRLHIVFNIVILALTTPLGIVIGILVTEHVDENSGVQAVVIGVLQGLAAGTLLYVSFYEVLEKDKLAKAGMTGLLGFFFIFFGFSVMAGLQAIGGGHSHGGVDGSHGHSHGLGQSQAHHDDDHHHGDHDLHTGKDHLDHLEQNVRAALANHDDHHGHSHDHKDHDDDHNHGHSHDHKDHDDDHHGHSHDHAPHGHSHAHDDHLDQDNHDHGHSEHDDHNHDHHDELAHEHEDHKHNDELDHEHNDPKHSHEHHVEDPSFLRSQVQLNVTNANQEISALNKKKSMRLLKKQEHVLHQNASSPHLNHDHPLEPNEAFEHNHDNDSTQDHDHEHHDHHENEDHDHGHEHHEPNMPAGQSNIQGGSIGKGDIADHHEHDHESHHVESSKSY